MTAPTLETLYTSPKAGFGVPASPVQRAILRLIEGRPLGELVEDEHVVLAFGGAEALAALPATAPLEVDLLAGIRTGKSQIAACRALHASQTVDLSHLSAGEVPRVSVISLDLDKARVLLDHLVGTMQARPALRALLVEPPTGDTVLVRHPGGRVVEIAVVAGARAGASVVARWSAGCIFDEFCRMFGSGEAVVNYGDARRAVLGRLLPGAQVLSIGSPWAPMGPAYERHLARFGKPTAEHVVVRARADWMNPAWWTPARVERLRATDDLAFATDVEATFADPSEAFITGGEIKAATRGDGPAVLPPQKARRYVVGTDPGTRGNAWTVVVLAGYRDAADVVRFEVVLAKEWRGSSIAPLSPARVFNEIAKLVAPYGPPLIVTDQHAADANVDLGARVGLRVKVAPITAQNRSELFETLKGAFVSGTILSLPDDRVLASDLRSVRRRLTVTGITYDLPRTQDGRHADYVPALCLALAEMGSGAQARAAAATAESFARRAADFEAQYAAAEALGDPVARERMDRLVAAEDAETLREVRMATTSNPLWVAESKRRINDDLIRIGSAGAVYPAGHAEAEAEARAKQAAEIAELDRRIAARIANATKEGNRP